MSRAEIEKNGIEKTEMERKEIVRKETEGTEAEKKGLSPFELSRFKQFISDWSSKEAGGRKINELLQLGEFPLSWYYRPILYSSLLPAPFATAKDFLEEKEKDRIDGSKIELYSFAFRKGLLLRDFFHKKISLLKGKDEREEEMTKKEKEEDKERKEIAEKEGKEKEEKGREGAAEGEKKEQKEEDKERNDFEGKILFLTFTNYIQDNSPPFREAKIMEKIKEDGKYEVLMLVADPLSSFSPRKIRQLSRRQFSHKPLSRTLYDYYTKETDEKAEEEAGKLAKKWRGISREEKRKMLSFEGRDVFSYFQQNLDFLYSEDFIFTMARLYYTYLRLLKKENVKAVVLSSQNNIFEKTLIAAAFRENVPVFVIQHGIGLGAYPTIDTPKNVKFAVFSEKYRQELSALGIRKENIEIVGPIIFDGIEKFSGVKKTDNRKVLLATSPFVEDRFLEKEEYFRKVKKILQELKEAASQIIIKLHPREKYREEYEYIMTELSLPSALFQDIFQDIGREDFYGLIRDSDLVITFGSTVALEAMIIRRPTLTIELFDGVKPTNDSVCNPEATTIVRHDGLIKEKARLLLEKGEQKRPEKLVDNLCYKVDGKASERIVGFIYDNIKQKDNKSP